LSKTLIAQEQSSVSISGIFSKLLDTKSLRATIESVAILCCKRSAAIKQYIIIARSAEDSFALFGTGLAICQVIILLVTG